LDVPDTITCVDCGQTAHRMTEPSEFGWEEGDVVAYRCRGCNDRWDMVVEETGGDDTAPGSPGWRPPGTEGIDIRQFLNDRKARKEDQAAPDSE